MNQKVIKWNRKYEYHIKNQLDRKFSRESYYDPNTTTTYKYDKK